MHALVFSPKTNFRGLQPHQTFFYLNVGTRQDHGIILDKCVSAIFEKKLVLILFVF